MDNTIYETVKNSQGLYERRERLINPKTQQEADAIYDDLAGYLAPEVLHMDGEATDADVVHYHNLYMRKALQVEIRGFLPSNDSDVWTSGDKPSSVGFLKSLRGV